MTKLEMLDFVKAVIEASDMIDTVAVLQETRNASVRFGQNRITQNLDVLERELQLTVGDGSKKAVLTSQKIEMKAIPSIIDEARFLLKNSKVDPEYMPPVEAGQVYPVIEKAFDEFTSNCPAAARMEAVGKVIDKAVSKGYQTAGICTMIYRKKAFASSTGNLAFHESTNASISFTMDMGLASSYINLNGAAWSEIDVDQAVEKVAKQTEINEGAVDIEPGDYKLIFEPEATWNLIMFFPWIMNARNADEGTSVFSGMEGKKVAGEEFSLTSSLFGRRPAEPFNDEGLPSKDVVWFDKGVLKNLPCDRYTAQNTNREPLFFPATLDMAGGDDGSVEDLIKDVDKGILFRRFWYIRFVDQKTLKLTGMTRDGVFLVENGKIVKPLKDFRWNWRPLEIFSNILKIGTAERKSYGTVPPVVIDKQHYPFTD